MAYLRKTLLGLAFLALTVMGLGSAQAQVTGCPIGSTQILGCYRVDGTTITVNGGVITAVGAASASISVGVTTIGSGTTTRVLFDNAGVLGEYVISGSGNVAMTTSPVFTTPTLGVASGTSLADAGFIKTTGAEGSQFQLVLGGQQWNLNAISGGNFYIQDFTGSVSPFVIAKTTTNSLTIGTSTVAVVGPITGSSSLALSGCTIGTDKLCVTGTSTFGGNVAFGANSLTGNFTVTGVPILSGLSNGTPSTTLNLDGSNNVVKAVIAAGSGITVTPSSGLITISATGGGGGSISVSGGGNTTTGVTTVAFGNGVGCAPNGANTTSTCNLTVTDITKTTSYQVAATDMANALNLAGTSGTPALTLPAASSTIFAPGMSVNVAVTGTVPWTITNSTGLTMTGLNSTTLYPGASGSFVANANGTGIDFFPGCQVATTSKLGCVEPDGTTITISAGVITAIGGSATSITVGTTTIGSGTTNGLLYDNGGVLGNLATGNNGVLITSGGGVPSISSTLPSAVQGNITTVGTIGTGVWQGTVVGATYGGTGINNGTNTLTLGNALTFASLTVTNDVLFVSSSGNVGQETFATACTSATAAAFGCVKVDNATITASSGIVSGEGASLYIANAGSTGTTVNKLAKLTGAPSTAVITATGDPPSSVAVGVVTAGAGTSGIATIQYSGIATCVFDGPTTAGHAAQISSSTAGDCTDSGSITPNAGQIVGTVLGTIGSAGNAPVALEIPQQGTSGIAFLNLPGQTYTGGIHPQVYSNGTASSGTKTIDCGNGPLQSLINNGAFTLAMSANDGSCVVEITNGASAGTITFSGFKEGSNTGDSLTTTNGNLFHIALTETNAHKHYLVSALQ